MALTCAWDASSLGLARTRHVLVAVLSNLLLIQMCSTPEALILRGIRACALLSLPGYRPLISWWHLRPRGKSVVDNKGLTATWSCMIISSFLPTKWLIADAFLLLRMQHVHIAAGLLMLSRVQLLQERSILLIGSCSSSSMALLCTREDPRVALLEVRDILPIRRL